MYFSPGHITAVFKVHKDSDILRTGTTGFGFCIDKGVTTKAEKGPLKVYDNNKEYEAEVTKKVCELMGVEATIRHTNELHCGYGFGISAAAALSTALELNDVFSLNLTKEQCAQAAHRAEAELLTVLGDVISEYIGGFEMRTKPGAPGIGMVAKKSIKAAQVTIGTLDRIPTPKILSGDTTAINESASKYISHFSPSLNYISNSSLEFAYEIGLVDKGFHKIIDTIKSSGIHLGVCMLGKTLFSFDNAEEVFKEHLHNVTTCNIDTLGARKV